MFGANKVRHEGYIRQSAVTTAIVGSSLISGAMGSSAAQGAANTQAGATLAAAQLQQQTTQQQLAQQQAMFNTNLANQQPYMNAGQTALSQLQAGMGSTGTNGALTQNFTAADLNANMAPNYQFMLNQGLQSLQSSAAARGGLLTGQGLKDVNNYAQNTAQSGYQQAYQNYVTNQTNQYNRLSAIAGLGQSAAAGVGNNGVQTSANMANTAMSGTANVNNLLTSGAAAQAAGQVGSANAWSGALNNGLNQYTTQSFLSGLQGQNAAITPATSYGNAVGSGYSPLVQGTNGLTVGMGGTTGSTGTTY